MKNKHLHIDNETIALFAEHRLSKDDEQRIIEHIADCKECRIQLMETRQFVYEQEKLFAKHLSSDEEQPKKLWHYIVPLALAASIALIIIPVMDTQDPSSQMRKSAIVEEESSWVEDIFEWVEETLESLLGYNDEEK